MVKTRAQIIDEGALHKYRTEIPNTIIRGILARGLSIYAKWLYVYLKSVAGDRGACWQSLRTIAKGASMTLGTVTRARHELIKAKLVTVSVGDKARHIADKITIVDIWPANMAEFSSSSGGRGESCEDTEKEKNYSSRVPGGNAKYEARSSGGRDRVPETDLARSSGDTQEDLKDLRRSQEKKEDPPCIPPKGKRTRFVPDSFVVTDTLRAWAAETVPHIDIDAETAKMRDWEYKSPHSDWAKAWRNWMRRAAEKTPKISSGVLSNDRTRRNIEGAQRAVARMQAEWAQEEHHHDPE